MNGSHTLSSDFEPSQPLADWTRALIDGEATSEQHAALGSLLAADTASRQWFVDQLQLHASLTWDASDLEAVLVDDAVLDRPSETIAPPFPPLDSLPSPLSTHFSAGWPVAYLIATIVFIIGLTIGALVQVSQPAQYVGPGASRTSNPQSPIPNPSSIVARITGMVDCQWAEPSTESVDGAYVPLGRKYALSSGLMEITYDTGARVILQGPVTYEVESPTGGYLSLGKLTARLEQKSEVRGQTSEAASQKSGIRNALTSDLCPLTSGLFAVRTPTAIVTDLGTEFAVEVDKKGDTTSHVFRGLVQVQGLNIRGRADGIERTLRENESVRVERCGGDVVLAAPRNSKDMHYVRAIPDTAAKKAIKIFDLVDVVAGGDGYSGQRNRGIDSATGEARTRDVTPQQNPIIGDGKYHRVEGMPFVDGVFVPKSAAGPVQIDSAGHMFAGFAPTDNNTCGYVWAIKSDTASNIYELDGVNYTMHGHAMLEMHANKGITFDLQAIRLANADYKVVRFQTAAGNTERVSERGYPVWADVWVFVDGQVKFRRREINRYNRAMQIVIPINDQDRFLTLVATDGGNGYGQDQIMFGDPRLELVPVNTTTDPAPLPEAAEH